MDLEPHLIEFSFYALRFLFCAIDSVQFPSGQAANIFRGAFGLALREIACVPRCENVRTCGRRNCCHYARMFEPTAISAGPSGLVNWPRPFVLRAVHLDGKTIEPGAPFFLDFHLFDVQRPAFDCLIQSFDFLMRQGVGPQHGRASLQTVYCLNSSGEANAAIWRNGELASEEFVHALRLNLLPSGPEKLCEQIRICFVTPTELKGDGGIITNPNFSVLVTRIRDRLSILRELYGAGALPIDFRTFGDEAKLIRLTTCQLKYTSVVRRSSRTGQIHPLNGFVGYADYEGHLRPFIPYLRAAQWTGVGRQTVWGKGQILLQEF